MGYFQVRFDSRVVIYDRRAYLRLTNEERGRERVTLICCFFALVPPSRRPDIGLLGRRRVVDADQKLLQIIGTQATGFAGFGTVSNIQN